MSLLRRNKADKDKGEQAVPADGNVPSPAAPKASASSPGIITRIRNYIVDSYNGLYKIVLEPSMPTKQTVAVLALGLIIGLIWGYVLAPTIFYGGSPNKLSQGYQDQWILSAAYALDSAPGRYDATAVANLLSQVPDPTTAIANMLADPAHAGDQAALSNLQMNVLPALTASAEKIESPGFISELASGWLIPLIIVLIATPIIVVVWRLLIQPNIAAPIVDQIKAATNPAYRAQKQKAALELKTIKEQKALGEKLKAETAAAAKSSDLGEPVKQSVFIYSKGRSFDESTEIELSTGEFLGQCGTVIPDVVAPDPVAVEVWLFDIFGSENKRKIFITEAAAGNAALRAKIEDDVDDPANDVIVAAPGATITLESGKLRLQSKLAAMSTGADGRFESFQMTVQAWQKDARKAAAPAMPAAVPAAPAAPSLGALPPFDMPPAPAAPLPPAAPAPRPMSDYDSISFDPPPAAPSRPAAPPPPAPAARPLSDYDDITFDPPPAAPLRPAAPPPPAPAARPLSDYDDITFDPPPAPPARPAAPPPAASPQPPGFGDEDDPFGGTGDFTPLNTGR